MAAASNNFMNNPSASAMTAAAAAAAMNAAMPHPMIQVGIGHRVSDFKILRI